MGTDNQLATLAGNLLPIKGVSMLIPNTGGSGSTDWKFYALPQVTDSKDAQYSDITILGRSSPIPTFSHSNYRKLQIVCHLHSVTQQLVDYHVNFIRAVASLTHPEYNQTYRPPRLAWFRCGKLIGDQAANGQGYVRLLVEGYSYSLETDQPWLGSLDLIPQYISLNIDARVVYGYARLPGADDVLGGRW